MGKEILIIRLSSIGDVIHSTPVASSLKTAWPDCKITWLVGEVAADLLRHNPYIDELIVWSRERFEKHIRDFEFKKAVQAWHDLQDKLSGKEFYAVLDIHGLFLTGLIAKQARAQRYIGLEGARELNSLFMTETAKPLGRHVTDRYLGVLTPLGITDVDRKMTLVVPKEARQVAEKLLEDSPDFRRARYAVIVPGTAWPSKNWPIDFFVKIIQLLSKDFTVILAGGRAELKLGKELEIKTGIPLINTIGRSGLLETAGVLEQAAVVISGDTGLLHIAAALDIPTVAVFGPTNPEMYAPQGKSNAALFAKLPCSFCHKQRCPKGAAECLSSITPAAVVRKVYSIVRIKPEQGLPGTTTFSRYVPRNKL